MSTEKVIFGKAGAAVLGVVFPHVCASNFQLSIRAVREALEAKDCEHWAVPLPNPEFPKP